MLPMVASAVAVEINGIWYNLDATNQTAEVTYNNGGNSYSGNITIPSSVNYDNIDYNVTSIGESAFKGCTTLESISLPSTILTIGASAFIDCSSLDDFTIPNSVTSIGNGAFHNCIGLTNFTIPDCVTSIGENAFYGCENIQTIDIPNGVMNLANCTFAGCSSLTSISIPNTVVSIGEKAFGSCTNLNNITLPNSLLEIKYAAFFDCKSITSIIIPSSVKEIGECILGGCDNLISIVVEEGNLYYDSRGDCNAIIHTATNELIQGCKSSTIPNTVTCIGASSFQQIRELTSITIPNNVKNIGSHAFYGCNGLNSITIPESVDCLGPYACAWCSALTNVNINNGVTIIGEGSFYRCSNLISITIPASVTTIGCEALGECSELTTVSIGSSVKVIGNKSFSKCSRLTDVYCYAEIVPSIKDNYNNPSTNLFEDTNIENATLHVPAYSTYITTAPWNGFGTITRFRDHTTVTIGSTGMATYCPMDDVDFSTVNGLKAYTATGYDHGTLTVSRVLNAPAGTGLLLQGEAGSYDVPYATSTGYYINLLHGLMTDTQVSPTEGSYTNFILGQKNGVTTFYRLSEAGTVAAGKAYLQLPTSVVDDSNNSRVMRIVAEDEKTGVRSVELLTNSEGENSEELFDLQGRRVAKPSKGIYIVGGQKVVVK